MSIESILSLIDSEIARLVQARALLANLGAASAKVSAPKTTKAAKVGKKRVLSADARKRIADAQRRRWAAQKAKAKPKAK